MDDRAAIVDEHSEGVTGTFSRAKAEVFRDADGEPVLYRTRSKTWLRPGPDGPVRVFVRTSPGQARAILLDAGLDDVAHRFFTPDGEVRHGRPPGGNPGGRIAAFLPGDLLRRVEDYRDATGVSMSAAIKHFVQRGLDTDDERIAS